MAHVYTPKVIIIGSEVRVLFDSVTNYRAGTGIVSWRLLPFCALRMLPKFRVVFAQKPN